METKKVEHELSSDMEKKIVHIAKFGFKIYLIMAAIGLTIMILGGTAFYLFFFKPVFQKTVDIQNKAEQNINDANKRIQEGEKEFNKMKENFDSSYKQIQEQISGTKIKITP